MSSLDRVRLVEFELKLVYTDLLFYRATHATHASAVLAIVILSVGSVCPCMFVTYASLVTKRNNALGYFDTTPKGNHYGFLTPTVVGRRPLPSEVCAKSDPSPSKHADFDRFPLTV